MLHSQTADAQYGAQRIGNPFCSAPTYVIAHEPRNAGINRSAHGVTITVSSRWIANRPLLNALLAHECGHVRNRDWVPPMSAVQIHQRELAADCYAARALASRGDRDALRALLGFVGSCGNRLSGPPGYPTCNQRRAAVMQCSAAR
jgi:hypothetical protein